MDFFNKKNVKIKFIDRIEKVKNRFELLPLLDEIDRDIKDGSVSASEYSVVAGSLLNHISTAAFGQLTMNEFNNDVINIFIHDTFADETLPLLIYKIGDMNMNNTCQLKVVEIINTVLEPQLISLLRRENSTADNHRSVRDSALCQTLCSFPDRLFNYFGFNDTKNFPYCQSSSREYETRILRSIQTFLSSDNAADGNLGLCGKLIAQIAFNSETFIASLTTWLLCHKLTISPAVVLLHPEVDIRRQESVLIAIFSKLRNGRQLMRIQIIKELQSLFGDAVKHNAILKRLLTRKLLLERVSLLGQSGRPSRLIAQYLYLVGDSKLCVVVFRQMVSMFADQSRLLNVVGYDQQLQTAAAILDLVKIVPDSHVPALRDDVMMEFTESLPAYLMLADNARRHIGLFVTEFTLERLRVGGEDKKHRLCFDYNDEDATLMRLRYIAADDILSGGDADNDDDDHVVGKKRSGSPPIAGVTTTAIECQPSAQRVVADVRTAILDSDDEETPDKPGSFIDDGLVKEELLEFESQECNRPHYLRDCLEALESERTEFQVFTVLLRALPRLVRERAVGFDDVASEVFDRMCCLEDRFRTPHFHDLRKAAAAQTLAHRPDLVGHAARVLFSQQCSMATRFFILGCLDDAAAYLAGERRIADDGESPKVEVVSPSGDQQLRQLGRVIRRNSAKVSIVNGRKNDFADVLPQFAFPLLNVGSVGSHLDLYDRDSILMGKILSSVGQMIFYARSAPTLPPVVSAVLTLLRALRRNPQTFIVSGCLFCYAAIADTPMAADCYNAELAEALEWMQPLVDASDAADPMYRETLAVAFVKLRRILYGDTTE